MKFIGKLKTRLKGLIESISRYPLTTVFLLAGAIINGIAISKETEYFKLLLTFLVGAFLSSTAQVIYERFFNRPSSRYVLMGLVILLTAGYYLIIRPSPHLSMEIGIRTGIALFAVLITFIWVPSIRSSVSFNESFMIAFKTFFNTLFFSGILFGGVSIIIRTIDLLLFNVDYTAVAHTANIIFILFAPIYFLSLIPVYPGVEDWEKKEVVDKRAYCPRFLEILISYIIIPLIAVFTIILLVYIIINIREDFWKDNLLEPMLVSYSITVILVYILASRQQNKFALFFRRVFPKVLVPIVLFQAISSVLKLGDMGVTHMRYFVILYGIFAMASGILLSFLPIRKNGVIAAMLIVFAVISILPPVDAFTVSRASQTGILKEVLVRNDMLVNNSIRPKEGISGKDKQIISEAVTYLSMMQYTDNIQWLPNNFDMYKDFYKTFGFKKYDEPIEKDQMLFMGLKPEYALDVAGYDHFVRMSITIPGKENYVKICDIAKGDKHYILEKNITQGQGDILLSGENGEEIIRYQTREIFDSFKGYHSIDGMLTVEEATFTKENNLVKMTLVIQNLEINKTAGEDFYGADLYVFIKIK
ncbi:MAG: DUF4153 domain-containing protein [Eubacteriales bacterium]|nr:DUF4153 domain-containing protein [Eubacteriales bacterium]